MRVLFMNGIHPSIEISEVGFIVHMKWHVFMLLKFYLEKRKDDFVLHMNEMYSSYMLGHI